MGPARLPRSGPLLLVASTMPLGLPASCAEAAPPSRGGGFHPCSTPAVLLILHARHKDTAVKTVKKQKSIVKGVLHDAAATRRKTRALGAWVAFPPGRREPAPAPEGAALNCTRTFELGDTPTLTPAGSRSSGPCSATGEGARRRRCTSTGRSLVGHGWGGWQQHGRGAWWHVDRMYGWTGAPCQHGEVAGCMTGPPREPSAVGI